MLQDNNCKLVYTTSPLRLYANGEWLDELSPAEAEILKHLADGKAVDYAFLCQLTDADNAVSLDVLLTASATGWMTAGRCYTNNHSWPITFILSANSINLCD